MAGENASCLKLLIDALVSIRKVFYMYCDVRNKCINVFYDIDLLGSCNSRYLKKKKKIIIENFNAFEADT